MKYDFRIGDYVEMVDGRVGYISSLYDENKDGRLKRYMTVTSTDGIELRHEYTECGCYWGCWWNDYRLFKNCFKRIGRYDFTEKQFKNTEPLFKLFGVNVYDLDEVEEITNEVYKRIKEIEHRYEQMQKICETINESDVLKGE